MINQLLTNHHSPITKLLKLTDFIVMLSPRSLFAQANSGGEASGHRRRKSYLFDGQILRFTSFRSE
jgi:hypothetical protein